MKNYKLGIAVLASVLIISSSAIAMVFGGSNFGIMGYPEHTCNQPHKSYEFTSQFEVDHYNNELERYIECIQEYVEYANNDIKRIQEAAEAAIDEANSL